MAATTRRLIPAPLRWLMAPLLWLERSRGRRRLALVLLDLIAAVPLGAGLWWATCLRGLPDVGAPPGATASPSVAVPAADNAFVPYQQAAAMYRHVALAAAEARTIRFNPSGWAGADPIIRRWVDDNRAALATWRRGAERPDAQALPPVRIGDPPRSVSAHDSLHQFARMALLEGSRLEEQGDREGAWRWYRAADRSGRHAAMCNGLSGLIHGQKIRADVERSVQRWATDPKVGRDLLRRALDDVLTAEALAPASDADLLRAGYPEVMSNVEERVAREGRRERLGEGTAWYSHVWVPGIGELEQVPAWARFVLGREPERSRRVVRLVFANWIAAAEAGGLDRPTVRVPGGGMKNMPPPFQSIALYEPAPAAPPAARALSAEALARWYGATPLVQEPLAYFWGLFQTFRTQQRAGRGRVALLLADELYRREHGEYAPAPAALVGRYLPAPPAGRLAGRPAAAADTRP